MNSKYLKATRVEVWHGNQLKPWWICILGCIFNDIKTCFIMLLHHQWWYILDFCPFIDDLEPFILFKNIDIKIFGIWYFRCRGFLRAQKVTNKCLKQMKCYSLSQARLIVFLLLSIQKHTSTLYLPLYFLHIYGSPPQSDTWRKN